jgi:hypothetical protein
VIKNGATLDHFHMSQKPRLFRDKHGIFVAITKLGEGTVLRNVFRNPVARKTKVLL